MSLIPTLWEAKEGRSLELRSSRPAWATWQNPIFTKNIKISQVWWCVPVIPAIIFQLYFLLLVCLFSFWDSHYSCICLLMMSHGTQTVVTSSFVFLSVSHTERSQLTYFQVCWLFFLFAQKSAVETFKFLFHLLHFLTPEFVLASFLQYLSLHWYSLWWDIIITLFCRHGFL